jgi:hypothetical protein
VTYCETSHWLFALGYWLLAFLPQPFKHLCSGISLPCTTLKPKANSQELKAFPYQELLETPGISPLSARPRKHKRQRPNLRRKARGRPQIEQRLRCWVENFGFLFVLAIFAVVAIFSFVSGLRPSAFGS